MNVFVLNAGRVGSTTFTRACEHITNYTAGHEILRQPLGAARFAYPPNHIEVDNRLSWLLGRLDRAYGDRAMYVHLRRDTEATVASYAARTEVGILRVYRRQVLRRPPSEEDGAEVARDFLDTVTTNIELFLRDKTQVMDFQLEDAAQRFPEFWSWIGAEGDLGAALAEFGQKHNSREELAERRRRAAGG